MRLPPSFLKESCFYNMLRHTLKMLILYYPAKLPFSLGVFFFILASSNFCVGWYWRCHPWVTSSLDEVGNGTKLLTLSIMLPSSIGSVDLPVTMIYSTIHISIFNHECVAVRLHWSENDSSACGHWSWTECMLFEWIYCSMLDVHSNW